MARRVFPDEAYRLAYQIRPDNAFGTAGNLPAVAYAALTGSGLADIRTEPGGVSVPGSVLTVDVASGLPDFQGPDGDVDVVFVSVNGGPRRPVRSRSSDRIAAVEVTANAAETPAGAQAKANAAVAASAPRYATMRFDPTSRPNGALPATADTGETLAPFVATNPAPLSINGGLIVHTPTAGVNSAGYLQTQLSSRVRRMGAMVSWPTNALGIAAFVIPSASWADGSFDNAGFHLTLNGNGTWVLSRFAGGTSTIASSSTHGRFPSVWGTGLQRFDFWLDPETQTCVLVWPDNSFTRITSPYFASETANYAIWELFENNGTDVPASFGPVWASTVDAPAYQEIVTPHRLPKVPDNPAIYNASGALTVDFGATLTHQVTLTGNVTSLTFSTTSVPPRGAIAHLELVQDGTGSRTLSGVSSTIKWAGGATPALSTAVGQRDIFRFRWDGGSWSEVSRSLLTGTTAGTVAAGNDSRIANAPARGRIPQSMLTPVVAAGDSISTTAYAGVPFAAALGGYTSGTNAAFTLPSNAGVGGNTSTQLLARFNTDVISKLPALVHILIGTNDAGQAVPVATFAANLRSMVSQCAAIGARVVLGTVPPSSAIPTSRNAYAITYNQWLCRFALSQGIQVADYYRALVDTSTGGLQSAYDSGDGVHPSPAGISAMASELAASITRAPSPALLLAKDDPDPWNYARNGLFLSSWATGWTRADAFTGVTLSTPADSTIQGNWGKITASASSGEAVLSQSRSTSQGGTAYVVGNWTMTGARVQSSALSAGQFWTAKNKFLNIATIYLGSVQNKFCAVVPGGVVLLQDSAASAASTANVSEVHLGAGTGDVSVAQFTVYDLTAMGVTDASGNLV